MLQDVLVHTGTVICAVLFYRSISAPFTYFKHRHCRLLYTEFAEQRESHICGDALRSAYSGGAAGHGLSSQRTEGCDAPCHAPVQKQDIQFLLLDRMDTLPASGGDDGTHIYAHHVKDRCCGDRRCALLAVLLSRNDHIFLRYSSTVRLSDGDYGYEPFHCRRDNGHRTGDSKDPQRLFCKLCAWLL